MNVGRLLPIIFCTNNKSLHRKKMFITSVCRWCSPLCFTAGNRSDDQILPNICQNHHEILKIRKMSGWCYHIVKHPRGISDLGDDGGIIPRRAELMFSLKNFNILIIFYTN